MPGEPQATADAPQIPTPRGPVARMARRPRRRPAALLTLGRYGGFGLAALLSLSLIWSCDWSTPTLYLGLDRGVFYFSTRPNPMADGVVVAWARGPLRWQLNAFPSSLRGVMYWRGWLPLWIPLVLLVAPTAIALWLRRRPYPTGQCPACGYDLRGNRSGVCPECGTHA